MRSSYRLLALLLASASLSACNDFLTTAPTPDYRIQVMPSPYGKGMIAVPPECPDWRTTYSGSFENQPWPQYGCAQARNLAAQVDNPEDLLQGRDPGPASGEAAATSMARYISGKTEPLSDPNAPTSGQSTSGTTPGLGYGGNTSGSGL
ncbi:MAG: hypothetical protein HGA90_02595 [Alphaproteobacteria bacterium]|nr:hypothetical protein [Alphaproteobacteria bacterium]